MKNLKESEEPESYEYQRSLAQVDENRHFFSSRRENRRGRKREEEGGREKRDRVHRISKTPRAPKRLRDSFLSTLSRAHRPKCY